MTPQPTKKCEQCGAEMELIDKWSTKSPPLIGKTIEYAEYRCPECRSERLIRRKASEETWQSA